MARPRIYHLLVGACLIVQTVFGNLPASTAWCLGCSDDGTTATEELANGWPDACCNPAPAQSNACCEGGEDDCRGLAADSRCSTSMCCCRSVPIPSNSQRIELRRPLDELYGIRPLVFPIAWVEWPTRPHGLTNPRAVGFDTSRWRERDGLTTTRLLL